MASAVVFVVSASTFLLLLYFFMSASFIWVLIVLFCIGGVEVSIPVLLGFRIVAAFNRSKNTKLTR